MFITNVQILGDGRSGLDRDWLHRFHLGSQSVCGTGILDVRRGDHRLGRLVGRLLRFPVADRRAPIRVTIDRSGPGSAPERWTRQIGGRRLNSLQIHQNGCGLEAFGPIELRMRQAATADRLRLAAEGAALRIGARRLRLPRWCAPHAAADVWVVAGERSGPPRFELDVRIWVPCIGLLLSYTGYVEEAPNG